MQTVMVSYASLTDTPTGTLGQDARQPHLIGGVLKEQLGFDGLVVSATGTGSSRFRAAPNRIARRRSTPGSTWPWSPTTGSSSFAETVADVRGGAIPMAGSTTLCPGSSAPSCAGLFDASPTAGPHPDRDRLNCPRCAQLAREAVRKSLVLLKNDRGALPLKRGAGFSWSARARTACRCRPAAGR